MGNVVIGNNIKKERVMIDTSGNIIDRNSKAIIEPNIDDNKQFEAQPVPQPIPQPTQVVENKTLSIQEQIKEAEERVAQLKTLKKLRAEELKAELDLLEQE